MKPIITGLLITLILFTTGCEFANRNSAYKNKFKHENLDVIEELREAREPLFDNLISPLNKNQPLISASFANIDNLSISSTFGRMASEVISAGLTERGYRVIEVKMRDSLFIKQGAGEFMLSRQVQDVSEAHNAQAVLLGTYAVGGNNIYINTRLVRSTDNIVLGSHDLKLPINSDIKHMLGVQSRRSR